MSRKNARRKAARRKAARSRQAGPATPSPVAPGAQPAPEAVPAALAPPRPASWPGWERLAAAAALVAGLGFAVGHLEGSRRGAQERLRASMLEAPAGDFDRSQARARAEEWSEAMGFVVEQIWCLPEFEMEKYWRCDVIGEFAPTQPQVVSLRCERRGCMAHAMGISAMPAP